MPYISCFHVLPFGTIAPGVDIAAAGGPRKLNFGQKQSAFSLGQFRAIRTHAFLLSQRYTEKEGT